MAGGGLVRHRAPGQSRAVRIFNGTLTGIGELLITAGLVVALFLVWQLWWTGIDANASAQAVATQFHETQQLGELGNFSIAGHRRTYGNSFRRIDLLQEGDEIVVSTAKTWYVFRVTGHEIVQPEQVSVIAPVPNQPDAQPTERYITLTTCHGSTAGEFGNDQRWIVHAKFEYWMDRAEGRPASVLNDPGVN